MPGKRGCSGRPRKQPVSIIDTIKEPVEPKKKRGRPPLQPVADDMIFEKDSSMLAA